MDMSHKLLPSVLDTAMNSFTSEERTLLLDLAAKEGYPITKFGDWVVQIVVDWLELQEPMAPTLIWADHTVKRALEWAIKPVEQN
jgi:hypothetical protein